MNDRSIPRENRNPHTPVISNFFHLMALSVLVFLRSSFGFSFLRPIGLIFTAAWIFAIFCGYVWFCDDPEIRSRLIGLCYFGCAGFTLFAIHSLVAFVAEVRRKGQHDLFSGKPIALWLVSNSPTASKERFFKMALEPFLVLSLASYLTYSTSQIALGIWLAAAGTILFFKESLSFWNLRRRAKPVTDGIQDIEEIMEGTQAVFAQMPPGSATFRKPKHNIPRQAPAPQTDPREAIFAAVLGIKPPFSLKKAQSAYKRRIKRCHPDRNDSPDSTEEAADLNAAWEFFQNNYGE